MNGSRSARLESTTSVASSLIRESVNLLRSLVERPLGDLARFFRIFPSLRTGREPLDWETFFFEETFFFVVFFTEDFLAAEPPFWGEVLRVFFEMSFFFAMSYLPDFLGLLTARFFEAFAVTFLLG